MNFDCVGTDSKGMMYMKYHRPFTTLEKIQLLQRSILVNSFAYYQLDENLLSDFQYDNNAKQLADLKKEFPDDFKCSRYHEFFKDFCSEDDNIHYTSGFDLLERVKKKDPKLYLYLHMDAIMALDLKAKRGV